jgi:hypothetical protein
VCSNTKKIYCVAKTAKIAKKNSSFDWIKKSWLECREISDFGLVCRDSKSLENTDLQSSTNVKSETDWVWKNPKKWDITKAFSKWYTLICRSMDEAIFTIKNHVYYNKIVVNM